MLCSLPAPKSSSSSSSASSSWLDRLHSLKGFTAPSPAAPPPPAPPPPNPNPNPPPSHVLDAILSDLFVIPRAVSAPSALPSKRHPCRKQPSPRICLLNPPPSSPPPPHLHNTKTRNKKKKKEKEKEKNKQQIRSRRTLQTPDPASPSPSPSRASPSPSNSKGRTDATVIDTSTPGWKSSKLLIRKGTIWKIRDKKQCNAAFTKRKRLVHAANKHKHLLASHNPPLPLDQGENHEESIDATEVPVKRPRLSKLPSIPEAAKSIALHLKVRTNVKKKGLSSGSSLKENVQY